jgi:hypothetical protein
MDSHRLNVYTKAGSSLPSGWSAVGCVVDSSTRALTGYSFTSSTMTPGLCASTCASQGYSFAGTEVGAWTHDLQVLTRSVQYGDECYCGNSNAGSSAASSDCTCSDINRRRSRSRCVVGNVVCAGDSTQECGAGWR